MGRVSKTTNPFRNLSSQSCTSTSGLQLTIPEYDDLSRTKKVTSPDSTNVQVTFGLSTTGVVGTTKTITDQAGRERKGITDALGNMIEVIEDPDAVSPNSPLVTDYVFDTLGNLRKTTQGGQVRYFTYDSLGRILRAKHVEQDVNTGLALSSADPVTGNNSWTVGYTYDDNGNITSTTNARGQVISASYDHLNRLYLRDYSDSSMPDVSFYYDGNYPDPANPITILHATGSAKGKTTSVVSSVSQSNNTSFDSTGRLLTNQQITDGQTYNFSYSYTLSGALIDETYPSGRVVKNTLNSNGELEQVQSSKCLDTTFSTTGTCTNRTGQWTYAASFSYSPAGDLTAMQLGNGHWETTEYNERLQVKTMGLGTLSNNKNLLELDFGYTGTDPANVVADRNNGSMRSQTIKVPAVGTNAAFEADQTYTYDSLNRIQSATESVGGTQTWKQTFDIDRYGNRRFDTSGTNTTTIPSGCSTAVCNPTFDTVNPRNRFATSQGYAYDADGALTQDATGQRFAYDTEDRQIKFFAATNSTGTPDATYFYDGNGLRVKKISSSETTIFVYDASSKLIAEYSSQTATNPQVSYLTTDHLGSPRVITDQNGNVTSRKDFSAFGEAVTSSQRVGGTTGNGYDDPNVRQDYTGYQKDTESGLEYAQARYFNVALGRFSTPDPFTSSGEIRNPQSFNRYAYVLNSPYAMTDPLGLISVGASGSEGGCSAEYSACNDQTYWGIYFVMSRTTTYTTSSNVGNNSATINVSVTELWVEDSNGNPIARDDSQVSAKLSNVKGYTDLQQNQIKTIAEAAAKAALNIGVDVGRFLGLVKGESEFGMVQTGEGSVKNAVSNPSQLSSAGKGKPSRAQYAAWGTPEYSAVLQYNLEQSIIQVYQPMWRRDKGNLWQFLYDWNGNKTVEKNKLEQRVNFANRVSGIIQDIQTHAIRGIPIRTGRFEQFSPPSRVPTQGITPCSNVLIC